MVDGQVLVIVVINYTPISCNGHSSDGYGWSASCNICAPLNYLVYIRSSGSFWRLWQISVMYVHILLEVSAHCNWLTTMYLIHWTHFAVNLVTLSTLSLLWLSQQTHVHYRMPPSWSRRGREKESKKSLRRTQTRPCQTSDPSKWSSLQTKGDEVEDHCYVHAMYIWFLAFELKSNRK